MLRARIIEPDILTMIKPRPNMLVVLPGGKHCHILPSLSMFQEDNMSKRLPSHSGFLQKIKQKDGSNFRSIVIRKTMTPKDIIAHCYNMNHDSPTIIPETSGPVDWTVREKLEYLFYHTHTFLNGIRGFPVVLHKETQRFWNVSNLFPENIPEDDMGVLVDGLKDLLLPEVGYPEVISYLSKIRLCACCGLVSDISLKIKHPWLLYKRGNISKGRVGD